MNDHGSQAISPLLTITDAATLLNVSKATIRRWTNEGRLKCSRIGARGERRFRKADLMAFVSQPEAEAVGKGENNYNTENNRRDFFPAVQPD